MELPNNLNPDEVLLNLKKEFIKLNLQDKTSIEDFLNHKLQPYRDVYKNFNRYKILPKKFKNNINFFEIERNLRLSNIKIDYQLLYSAFLHKLEDADC